MPGQFDESQHPREADGRFTAGGGGLKAWGKGVDTGALTSKLTTNGDDLKKWSKADKGDQSARLEHSRKGKQQWTDWRPKGLAEQSWMGHWTGDPETGGKPTEERQKNVIDPIMHAALDHVKPAGPGEQLTAIFTMGGPGSGKSSMTREAQQSGKFVHVDPDDIRVQLPEYKQATEGAMTYRYAAAMTHPESSQIAKDMMKAAIQNHQHLIVDGTGKNAKSIIGKMEELRKAGYHIHLAYAHLGEAEGVKRVASRGEDSGRFVGEDVVRDAYRQIPLNFRKVSEHADTWAVHDTQPRNAPVVWKKGEDGKEQAVDEDFVNGFNDTYHKATPYDQAPHTPREHSLL